MKRVVSWIVVMVIAAFGLVSPVAANAQTGAASETLDPGGHVLRRSGDWIKNTQASASGVGFETALYHNSDGYSFGTILYDAMLPGQELLNSFMDGYTSEVTGYGTIDAGSYDNIHYELGTGDGLTVFVIFMDGELGAQSVGYMIGAPSTEFADAVTVIQSDFRLDGETVLQGVDGPGLQQQAIGGAPATDRTQVVFTDSVFVGLTEVFWGGDWEYDAASSMDTQVTLNQVDPVSGSLKLVTYGEFTDYTVTGATGALTTFTDAFFEGAGATNTRQVDGGQLFNGAEWRLYTFTLEGLDLSLFITVSQGASGEFVVSTVTSNTADLESTIGQVQQEISLDGQAPLLDGVDASDVTRGLGG